MRKILVYFIALIMCVSANADDVAEREFKPLLPVNFHTIAIGQDKYDINDLFELETVQDIEEYGIECCLVNDLNEELKSENAYMQQLSNFCTDNIVRIWFNKYDQAYIIEVWSIYEHEDIDKVYTLLVSLMSSLYSMPYYEESIIYGEMSAKWDYYGTKCEIFKKDFENSSVLGIILLTEGVSNVM